MTVEITPGTGAPVSTIPATSVDGTTVEPEHVQRFLLAFKTGAASVVTAPGDATYGVDVDITRLPSTTQAGATVKTADLDSGAGTDTVALQGIALPGSGGAVAGGTSTNPLAMESASANAALGAPADAAGAATMIGQLKAVVAATDGLEGLAGTLNGYVDQLEGYVDQLEALLGGATATAIPGASGDITSSTGVLMGFTARETSGSAAAHFRLRVDTAAGVILATVYLAQNESVRDWFGPSGITATGGIYFELVSGAVAGGVFTR